MPDGAVGGPLHLIYSRPYYSVVAVLPHQNPHYYSISVASRPPSLFLAIPPRVGWSGKRMWMTLGIGMLTIPARLGIEMDFQSLPYT